VQNQSKTVLPKSMGSQRKSSAKSKQKYCYQSQWKTGKKKKQCKIKSKTAVTKVNRKPAKKSIAKTLLFPSLILDDDEEQEIICFG